MTQESVAIRADRYDSHLFLFAPGDTTSAMDSWDWFRRLDPRRMPWEVFGERNGIPGSAFGPVSVLSGTEHSTSVPVALRENEWDVRGDISDEAILAEMAKYEPHELAVRIPPKSTYKIRARIKAMEISDEAILAEMVKYEPHELVVRIPPKRSTSIRVRITEVRKAKPRPIEPDPYL